MYPSKLTTEKVLTSINLVSQDEETNNLVLNSEALNVIRRLNGNVAVCVCVGKHKTGKSFLLNSLFKYFTNVPYNAFEVGHSKNGCTKGCWINKEVPVLKAQKKKDEMNLIFVDTEVNVYFLYYFMTTFLVSFSEENLPFIFIFICPYVHTYSHFVKAIHEKFFP